MWFDQGMTKISSPKWRGSTCWKKSRTNTSHPNNQTCFTLWKRCQQLKHGQILTLDWMGWEWNLLDTLCKKVHITSTTNINVHKKMKNFMVIQNHTFSSPKFLHNTTTTIGFGYWRSLVWSLEFGWSNFGVVSCRWVLMLRTCWSSSLPWMFIWVSQP